MDCPDTCSLDVQVEEERVVALEGNQLNPLTAGFMCAKVRRFPELMYGPTRVLHPQVRRGPKGEGRFERVGWDEALELLVEKLRVVQAEHGREAVLPVAYGGSNGLLSDELLDARFFRRIGASRLARTLCAAPSGAAAAGLYGKMAGVALEDYAHARLIVLWGVNPHASGIHLVPPIQAARKAGARLVVVDPRRTPLAKQADLHLALRPGTDLPLALAVIRTLFAEGHADEAFLAAHARGVDELRKRAEPWTPERAADTADVPADAIRTLAGWYAEASPAVVRCGWGLERNRNGGSAVAAVLALPAVAGKFGVRAGGYTMSNSGAIAIDSEPAINAPPSTQRTINLNQVGRALLEATPPIGLLFVYNGNPLATLPNQEAVRAGLLRDDLFTVVFEQVETDTARYADLLLPATTFLEHHELKRSYGAQALLRAGPVVPPPGEARSNLAVFAELCRRLDVAEEGDATEPDALVAALLAASPDGARLARELGDEGIARPASGGRPIQFEDVFPNTPQRKVELCPAALDEASPAGLYGFQPDPATPEHPLALISPATNRTISSTLGQLRPGQIPLRLHPDDARARGISGGQEVRVFNRLGEVRCLAQVDPDLRPGTALLPKGLWSHNTLNGRTANALAPDTLTDLGGGACFNDARVQVERVAP